MKAVLLSTIAVISIAGLIVWVGRKRLVVAIPCACAFMLFVFIAIPNLSAPRISAAQNACVSHLRFIQNAKTEWAVRNQRPTEEIARLDELFSSNNPPPYHYVPQCPSGGEYMFGALNENPTCTLSNLGHVLR